MKKYLLPNQGKFYKANMHCHTTLSDGDLTSNEVKKAYMDRGYSIVAFSDHDRCLGHADLIDDNFVAITSYEIDISHRIFNDNNFIQCYHLNCYSKNVEPPLEALKPLPPYTDIDAINDFISEHNRLGFLVCYNHPNWSLQTFEDYSNLKGLFACEIYNHSAAIGGVDGNQEMPYDALLRNGNKIFCIASDDNHNKHPFDSPLCDSFGGFIMIKAPELKYQTIMNSLEKGDFYASTGPEIKELYVEDGKLYIECSDARSINMTTAGRRAEVVRAAKGESVNSACFNFSEKDVYIRVQVTDNSGYRANTNAYFIEDLV
ncbi:MAG TPA: PHP domain-containing protein [Clostridia bacterium]|nr:PHP domain-containing protein [Clostridia bacterium]